MYNKTNMSCKIIEGSNFFSTKSIFANAECDTSVAFFFFAVLNILVSFLSNYLYTLRQQQRRMLLKVQRFEVAGKESDRWRSNFQKFLYFTLASQSVYIVQVIFIITSSLWQLLIMVVSATLSDWFLYEYSYVRSDKYDRLGRPELQ